MTVAARMLEARAHERDVDHAALALAIEALQEAVNAATGCADACLTEPEVAQRVECVQACADAADVAGVLARVLSRTGPTVIGSRALLDATAKMLSEVAQITGAHGAHDKHCRIASETMQRAQQALQALGADIAAAEHEPQ